MEIKDLQIFRSVAYQGSISKAAHELNHVQSHVTARIKHLEAEMNTKFFHRHSRGTSLNADGKKLLAYAENILHMVDEMKKDFQDSEHPSGKLEIGTVETLHKLPLILSAYHRKYPLVDLSLKTDVTEDLVQQLLKHQLDGAFITGIGKHPDLEQIEVFKEQLVLISNDEEIGFEELIRKPLLVFKSGCSYRSKLENWLKDEGIISAKVMEFGTLETILASVISGLGISIVPKSTIHLLEEKGLLKSYPIPPEYSNFSTVFIKHVDSYTTNSLQKLIETIQEVTSEGYFTPPLSVLSY
jgi:DNA-binding transcriptional LysR family regulator